MSMSVFTSQTFNTITMRTMRKQTIAFCLVAAILSITLASEEAEQKQKQKRQFAAALVGLGSLFGELFAGAAAETAIGAGLGVVAGAGIAAGISSSSNHHSHHTDIEQAHPIGFHAEPIVQLTGVQTGAQTVAPPTPNVTLCESTGFCTSDKCDLKNHLFVGNVLCTGGRKCCIQFGTCGVTARVGKVEGPGTCRLKLPLTGHGCHDDEEVSTVLTCNPGYTCCVDKNCKKNE